MAETDPMARALEYLCLRQDVIWTIFVFCALALVFNLIAFFGDTSDATSVIVVVNLIALVPLTLGSGAAFWKCNQVQTLQSD